MWKEGGAFAVFVRWPEPGGVLPRLCRRIGVEAAAQVYDAFLEDFITRLPGPPLEPILFAADHVEDFRARFPGLEVRPQRGRSESMRLHSCFEELLAHFPVAVVLRGAVPDLHPRMIASAFEMLDRRDSVVGGTRRGGVRLIGMREPRNVFRGVPWETERAFASLLVNLRMAHLDWGLFPARQEAETYEDLSALRSRLERSVAPATCAAMKAVGIGS